MKKQKTDNQIIFDKVKAIFEEHGALNTFTAMLSEIDRQEYDDLTIGEMIEVLFKRDKFHRGYLFLNEDNVQDVIFNLDSYDNFRLFKIENLAQEMRFEQFLSEIEENPCQLKLIA